MIVFAKTSHTYDSYTDFWRLVVASELPTCAVGDIDLDDDTKTYVFTPMNGETMGMLDSWRARRCKIIWWNLERAEDHTLPKSLAAVADAVDAVWVSDREYAARDRRFTYVPVAGHKHFGARVLERRFDVCHLAYLHGRRGDAVGALKERGVRIAPEAWGRQQQDETVAKSHLMLNMHQYEGMTIVAPIRFAVAASYAIPIVSEDFSDPLAHELTIARDVLWRLPDIVEGLLKDPARLRVHGGFLYERMCVDTDFRREVERACHALGAPL